MEIDKLTIGELKQIKQLLGDNVSAYCPWKIGANYFIRTVTHHHTGKLVAVTQQELILENACWIADDGRLANALDKCEFNEVEPFPKGNQVIIGRGSIIDATEIETVPTSQQ